MSEQLLSEKNSTHIDPSNGERISDQEAAERREVREKIGRAAADCAERGLDRLSQAEIDAMAESPAGSIETNIDGLSMKTAMSRTGDLINVKLGPVASGEAAVHLENVVIENPRSHEPDVYVNGRGATLEELKAINEAVEAIRQQLTEEAEVTQQTNEANDEAMAEVIPIERGNQLKDSKMDVAVLDEVADYVSSGSEEYASAAKIAERSGVNINELLEGQLDNEQALATITQIADMAEKAKKRSRDGVDSGLDRAA